MRVLLLSVALLLASGFFCHQSVQACPLCKDAISTPGGDEEEINNSPAAYNISIYLMAGMPYLLASCVGFFIYRGCQRNAEHRQRIGSADASATDMPQA